MADEIKDKVDKMTSKLSKFFSKKPSAFKGEGHTLSGGGPSKPKISQQPPKPSPSSSSSQPRASSSSSAAVSDESRRAAAEAALARLGNAAKPQYGSGSAANKNLFAQVRQEILREKHSTIKVADAGGLGEDLSAAKSPRDDNETSPVLSVNGVFYKCPIVGALQGSMLTRDAVMQKIRDFLHEQAADEPGAAACLMLVSLNRTVRGTTSSNEAIQACKETLMRYIDNIIQNPSEQKFRKIRVANKVFQERVLPMEGAELFLNACGFVRRRLANQSVSVNQSGGTMGDKEDPSEILQQIPADLNNQSISAGGVLGSSGAVEEDFLVLEGPVDEAVRTHLESLRDALVCVEPIVPELDRDVRLFRPSNQRSVAAGVFNLPDDFYNRSISELKSEFEQRTKNFEKSLELRTKQMRERDEHRERRKYRFSLIRIRFPILTSLGSEQPGGDDQQLILQGTFYAEEKYDQVVKFVADSLSDEWQAQEWCLWDPSTRKPIDSIQQKDAHLCDINLVPAAVLVFKPLSMPLSTSAAALFRRELLEKIRDL